MLQFGLWTERVVKTGVTILRILFGLHFLLNGLNFFLHLVDIPKPSNPLALELMGALVHSGIFDIAKVVEVTTGAALLLNRFVPLALVLAFPIAVVVGYMDVVLIGTWFGGWVAGGGTVLLNAALLLAYFKYYRPMFVMKADPGVI